MGGYARKVGRETRECLNVWTSRAEQRVEGIGGDVALRDVELSDVVWQHVCRLEIQVNEEDCDGEAVTVRYYVVEIVHASDGHRCRCPQQRAGVHHAPPRLADRCHSHGALHQCEYL